MNEISTPPQKTNFIIRAFNRVWQNPIVIKEMRSRMRRRRTYVILSGYLLLIASIIAMVYLSFNTANQSYPDPDMRRNLGKGIFYSVVILQAITINFTAPSFTSTSITNERELQTFDLLRTTLVSPRSIVFGKFLSGFLFSMLLLLAGVPLQTLAFLFGGVEITEFLISSLILTITAATFSMIGVYVSTLVKKNKTANTVTFLITNALMVGIPILVGFGAILLGSYLDDLFSTSYIGLSNPSVILQVIFLILGIFLASSNPAIAAVLSEIFLLEEDVIFFYMIDINSTFKFPFLSPWITFSIFYLILTWLFYWRATKRVSRKDKK